MISLVEQLRLGEEALLADSSLRFHTIVAAHPFGTDSFRHSLIARETTLGSATMPHESLLLLCSLLQPHVSDIAAHLVWHHATMSARETQAVLPSDVTVLKTVTLRLRDRLILVTGVGDFHLHREALRTLVKRLSLPLGVVKHATINPKDVDPADSYGLCEGMVSPFFPARCSSLLAALAFLHCDAMTGSTDSTVAISLSRFESLLIPQALFPTLLKLYASQTYPHLRLITL
ncbi:MAG: hypothetical protein ACYDER_08100 [Ktedonobacteraceae bacterium]